MHRRAVLGFCLTKEADELFCKEIADGFCGPELSENSKSETYALLAAASDECDR